MLSYYRKHPRGISRHICQGFHGGILVFTDGFVPYTSAAVMMAIL